MKEVDCCQQIVYIDGMKKFTIWYNDGVGQEVDAENEKDARKLATHHIRFPHTPDGRKMKIIDVTAH